MNREHNRASFVAAISFWVFAPGWEEHMPLSWIARGAASAERGRRLMELRGVTPNGHPLWARWEVDPLVGMHPNYRAIFPILTRRTTQATYNKAGRLGISEPRGKPWNNPNEIWRLKIYATGTREEVEAAFPGRSYGAIGRMARKRGFRRPARRPEPSGIVLIDQVLERAKSLGWTLTDLDSACRSRGYFSRRRWRTAQSTATDQIAVRALGGNVRARFPDAGASR